MTSGPEISVAALSLVVVVMGIVRRVQGPQRTHLQSRCAHHAPQTLLVTYRLAKKARPFGEALMGWGNYLAFFSVITWASHFANAALIDFTSAFVKA